MLSLGGSSTGVLVISLIARSSLLTTLLSLLTVFFGSSDCDGFWVLNGVVALWLAARANSRELL